MKKLLKKISHLIPDSLFLKIKFKKKLGKKLNLKNPQTFNEKLQWLKLHDRNPQYCDMVDKYEVKRIVANAIGDEYIIPTLGVWDKFDDIDFNVLPDQFVLKCTHDSGGLVICKDKSKFNLDEAKKKINKSLSTNYFWHSREWPYKSVKPRIIAEKFMIDDSGDGLRDYKFFCFNGEPKIIQVDFDRFTEHKKNLYTTDWELCDFSFNYPAHPEIEIKKPEKLEKMIELARVLAKDKPYVRIDFYSVMGEIFFGEITFFPASGFGKFNPSEYDLKLGQMIKLKRSSDMRGGDNQTKYNHEIIASKKDLKDWLSYEKKKYKNRTRLGGIIACAEGDVLWKYQKRLRKTEYYKNTRKGLRYSFSRFLLNRLQFKYGVQVRLNSCGRGLKIMHLGAVLVNGDVGEDCSIHLGVSIVSGGREQEVPVIGNNVVIGVNATVLGSARIADGIAVGANALVNKVFDEPNVAIAGVPAKKISDNGRETWNKKVKVD